MSATYNGTRVINIYALSGSGRQERESFYNTDVPLLLPITQTNLILAGDFNCVLSQADATGQRDYSKALGNLVYGRGLVVVGNMSTKPGLTHYTPMGAFHLDHVYVNTALLRKKTRMETEVVTFRAHFAIVVRLETSTPISS
jgi:endonuclease/exonuclease/phosphatase family metal-dependent hydrolase